jgi:hypothetical protein
MTGGALLGLILVSMGWLFFIGGAALNYRALRAKGARRAGLGPLPGVVGSVSVLFSVPVLAGHGIELPWPWLWILAPLAIDPLCAGGLVLLLRRK